MKVGDIDVEEAVFDKTKELLLKFGVKGWNMNDLARECNMSKRTLYKIIGNKEDLLYKLNINGLNANIVQINKFMMSDEPFPVLLNRLSNIITMSFDDYLLFNIKAIRLEYPRIKEMEEKLLRKHREVFIRFFQKGKDEGCLVDHAEAITIHKILHALIEYHIYNCNNKTDFKREMDEVLGTFLKSIIK